MEIKEVNIIESLLKNYKDKELIHFCSKQMDFIAKAIHKDPSPENMYRQMGAILQLSEYLKAVDARMNKIKKSVVVQ